MLTDHQQLAIEAATENPSLAIAATSLFDELKKAQWGKDGKCPICGRLRPESAKDGEFVDAGHEYTTCTLAAALRQAMDYPY